MVLEKSFGKLSENLIGREMLFRIGVLYKITLRLSCKQRGVLVLGPQHDLLNVFNINLYLLTYLYSPR